MLSIKITNPKRNKRRIFSNTERAIPPILNEAKMQGNY